MLTKSIHHKRGNAMGGYQSLNHSKFRIRYHLIFSTKYRCDCLVGIENSVEQVFRDIGGVSEFDIVEVGVDKNHVHLVVASKPTVAPVDIVRRLKQISVHRLWKLHYDHLAQFFWGKRRGSTVWDRRLLLRNRWVSPRGDYPELYEEPGERDVAGSLPYARLKPHIFPANPA